MVELKNYFRSFLIMARRYEKVSHLMEEIFELKEKGYPNSKIALKFKSSLKRCSTERVVCPTYCIPLSRLVLTNSPQGGFCYLQPMLKNWRATGVENTAAVVFRA